MKKKRLLSIFFILSVLIFIISCSKEFDNPIDPDIEGSIPPMPTDLRAFGATYNSIELSFEYKYQNALGIVIYRNNQIHDSISVNTTYIDSLNLKEEIVYSYKVCGYNTNGLSEFSNITYDTTLEAPDTLSPNFIVNSPLDSAIVLDDSIRISGKVSDFDGCVMGVFLGDPAIDSAIITDSLWYIDIFLDSLEHKQMKKLFLYAIDSNGNKTDLFWHFIWDTTSLDITAPLISLVEPFQNYSKVGDRLLNIKINVKDLENEILFVFLDGLAMGADNDSIFSKTVNMFTNHGDTTSFEIIAGDRSSNFNKDTLILYVVYDSSLSNGGDNKGPAFSVLYGLDIITTDTIIVDTISLNGAIFDPSGILEFSVSINNGEVINLGNSETWNSEFSFNAFTNNMVFKSIDSLGNVFRDTVIIYYDYQNKKPKMYFDTLDHKIVVGWDNYSDIDYKSHRLWVSSDVTADTNAATLIYNSINPIDSSYEYSQENDTSRYYFHYAMYDSAGNVIYYKFFAQYIQSFSRMITISAGSYLDSFTISYDYYMDSTEVTQGFYNSIMSDATYGYTEFVKPDWSAWGEDYYYPANNVNWYDAVLFCNARSKAAGLDTVYSYASVNGIPGNNCTLESVAINYGIRAYRLPTEDEWELAYRAGTTTDYYWGKNYLPYPSTLSDTVEFNSYAIWNGNAYNSINQKYQISEVASKLPNANGLYDMSGNVEEWCNNWRGNRPFSRIDYTGDITGNYRIICGGAWLFGASELRATIHRFNPPANGNEYSGFRCVVADF